jgi:hypothetical protein
MALGTVATWLAVGSGHAAGQLVDKVAGLQCEIARHEQLGVMTRNLFTLITLVFAGLVLCRRCSRSRSPRCGASRSTPCSWWCIWAARVCSPTPRIRRETLRAASHSK